MHFMSLIMVYFLRKLSLYGLSNHPSLVFFIQSTTACLFIITLQGERTVSYWAPPGFNLTVKLCGRQYRGHFRHRIITVLMVRLDQSQYSYARVRDAVFA